MGMRQNFEDLASHVNKCDKCYHDSTPNLSGMCENGRRLIQKFCTTNYMVALSVGKCSPQNQLSEENLHDYSKHNFGMGPNKRNWIIAYDPTPRGQKPASPDEFWKWRWYGRPADFVTKEEARIFWKKECLDEKGYRIALVQKDFLVAGLEDIQGGKNNLLDEIN